MKFGFKKYIYLLNDVTSLILDKDRLDQSNVIRQQRLYIFILISILLISILFNIYEYVS
ncbi:MAG: hypothetical protein WCG01_02840 [bacterium]